MPGLFFSNLWMLAGLTALSIPVLIHLLLRRKQIRVRFSTVQFFLHQDEQSSRRRKLRHWLLLSLRLLICTLLVLAFARPYLEGGTGGAAAGKRQVILVLDRSLSMQSEVAQGPKWARARDSAGQILSELKPTDRAALIGCGVRSEVLSEWASAAKVHQLLATLSPTCGATSLSEGLQQARRLASVSDPSAPVSIYIISDLQKSSSDQLAAVPLPEEAQVKAVAIGDLVTPNLAVTDLVLEPAGGAQPHALITSFSDEDVSDLKVEVAVDNQLTSSTAVSLPAGGSTNLPVTLPVLKPGWHHVRLQLRARDALVADNARFQSIFIPEPTRVWVAEARLGKRSFEEESFFLTAALDPSADSTRGSASRFAVEKMAPDELATRLSAANGQRPCDLVVLPGLKQLPSALGLALATYLQAGGGLLLFVGEGVSANRYNAEFRGFLPAQLGRVESSRDWESAWRIGTYATNSTVFGAFQKPSSGDLSLGRFTQRLALSRAVPGAVAARFEDGGALVIEGQAGRGRVVLVNTSADTSWSDWPKHKTFVPWLHGTAHYLAELTPTQKIQAQANLIAGVDSEIELGPGAAKASFKLVNPKGQAVAFTANDRGQLLDATFPEPGVYFLRDMAGTEVRRLAVNVPVTESDLTSLSASDFQQQLARSKEGPATTLAAGVFGPGRNHRELWRVLLLSALGLLVIEIVLANRTVA